jgi:hypothetical protein
VGRQGGRCALQARSLQGAPPAVFGEGPIPLLDGVPEKRKKQQKKKREQRAESEGCADLNREPLAASPEGLVEKSERRQKKKRKHEPVAEGGPDLNPRPVAAAVQKWQTEQRVAPEKSNGRAGAEMHGPSQDVAEATTGPTQTNGTERCTKNNDAFS